MTAAAREALADIASATTWSCDPTRLVIQDGAAAIASTLPIADVASAAYGALAVAAAELHALRGGGALKPTVDRRRAGLAMAGNEYLTVDGSAPKSWDPLTGYYACSGGAYVYIHANFPHHRDGLLTLFAAENDRDSLAARLRSWSAADAEEAAQSRGLTCMMVRARAEWEAHPQRAALAAQPVVRIDGLPNAADADIPTPPPAGAKPLSGLRVLDLSRVIAGPMAGRALAELGADVLRVSAPNLPFIEPLVIDTGFCKRAAHVDLTTTAGRATLRDLIVDADVLIDGFRPGALAAKGFGADDLAAINPRLVYATLSAFSDVGPWADRRGYDSYVQGGVGFTAPKTPGEAPVRLACQPLDYLTGALTAFGAVLALSRRAKDGRGRIVETSLARTAIWLWDMADRLGPEPAPPARNQSLAEAEAEGFIQHMRSEFGAVGSLRPPYGFNGLEMSWTTPPRPLGSSDPVWL